MQKSCVSLCVYRVESGGYEKGRSPEELLVDVPRGFIVHKPVTHQRRCHGARLLPALSLVSSAQTTTQVLIQISMV